MTKEIRNRGFHHVVYACKNGEETRHFYEDLLGMPLVHTEVKNAPDGFFRHLFFDTGDGSCIAFFEVSGVGENPDWSSEVSIGNGLPVWVNHLAFASDEERTEVIRERLAEEEIVPLMEVDHGWCHSLYYMDPNGIMVEFCRDTGNFGVDPETATERLSSTEDTDYSTFIQPLDVEGLRGFSFFPAPEEA